MAGRFFWSSAIRRMAGYILFPPDFRITSSAACSSPFCNVPEALILSGMRKPRAIRLALLGTVGLIGLTACEENDPLAGHDVLRSQAECASRPDPDACRTALADARAAHIQSAPRFANRQECEDSFGAGNCGTPEQVLASNDAFSAAQPAGDPSQRAPQQQAQGSGSVFMPLLMGYMMGRALGGPGLGAQPLYRDPNNTAYTGNRQLGQLSTNRFPDAPKATPTGVARGGFGRTGGTYSAAS